MSKLNINKNEWLELVFEGRNKEYGAYQLRKEEGATTTKAFISALVFITGIALLPVLLSSFADKPIVIVDEIPDCRITPVDFQPKQPIQKNENFPAKKASAKTPKTQDLVNVTIVAPENATPTEITTNVNLGQNNSENNAEGNGVTTPNNGVVTTPDDVPVDNGMIIATTSMVEKNPLFPGGIDAFLRMVGSRFRTPELEEEGTARLIVFFVVEKDGTLSNITVPKNPGYGLDQEAIRVLKSIKTKWEPGIYRGQPVRTQYSLPIVVKLQ